jgi:hypothetical protein
MTKADNYKRSVSLFGKNERQASVDGRMNSLSADIRNRAQGIAGDPLTEGVPKLITTDSEDVIDGSNNTSIVFGRDRPSTRLSGYGGAGYTQAGAIDIVVGRWGYRARSFVDDCRAYVNPSFENDAARIYISQKTDVDRNFKIPGGGQTTDSDGKSAIAIKADGIRIIAREGIKLVTRTDAKNSQGGTIDGIEGISLIAGGDDKYIEPMVKGNKTVEFGRELTDQVNALNGIVDSILTAQMQMNMDVTHHFHHSPFFGIATTPSPVVVSKGIKTVTDHLQNAKKSLVTQKQNLEKLKSTYLCVSGAKDIRSRFNYLN